MSQYKKSKTTIKITSEGEKKIRVTMGYNEDAVSFFKTLASRKYNTEDKSWSFDESDIESLVNKFKQLNLHFDDDRINQLKPKKLFFEKNIIKIISEGDQKIRINMPYNAQAVAFFKTLASRKYNTEDKSWSFDNSDLEKLLDKFEELELEYQDKTKKAPSIYIKQTKKQHNLSDTSSDESEASSGDEDTPLISKKKTILRLAFIDPVTSNAFIDHECDSLTALDILADIDGRTYCETLDKYFYTPKAIEKLEDITKKYPNMFTPELSLGGIDEVIKSTINLKFLQMSHMPVQSDTLTVLSVLDTLLKFSKKQRLWDIPENFEN